MLQLSRAHRAWYIQIFEFADVNLLGRHQQKKEIMAFHDTYIKPLRAATDHEFPRLLELAQLATAELWKSRGKFNKGSSIVYRADGERQLSLRAAVLVSHDL